MQGDFSRGHRGRQLDPAREDPYLRVFAQQRRLVLDSDLNAGTDALHERLRDLASRTACPRGSPDLGFLVTPGKLLALFRDLDGVVTSTTNANVHRDHATKYRGRYPSLRIVGNANVPAGQKCTATIRLREPFGGAAVVWCSAVQVVAATINGTVVNVPAVGLDDGNAQVDLANNTTSVVVEVPPGKEIWIGLIESREAANRRPVFHVAAGSCYLGGLPLSNPSEASWLSSAEPRDAAFVAQPPAAHANLAANDVALAYLEAWERHVGAAEDTQLREAALGGDDTTTRGRAEWKVKLAFVVGALPDKSERGVCGALDVPLVPGGTLAVTTKSVAVGTDKCALPAPGGYTGPDNRLYRFEVHRGGALGTAKFKWSRDNGAEVFTPIERSPAGDTLTFPTGTPLRADDVVEILFEALELADQASGSFDATAMQFMRPERAVGLLVRLVGGAADPKGVKFTMKDALGPGANASLPASFPAEAKSLWVRRWHDVVETQAATADYDVEDGIKVTLAGAFAARDYWQYEARVDGANANGAFRPEPHGPERIFAPLALLKYVADGEPLQLQKWLDDRFRPLCELTADDIAYDGGKVGSSADTVQEIVDELWTHSGCCDRRIDATSEDVGRMIANVLLSTTGDVKICLGSGVHRLDTQVAVTGRRVTLEGCPRAVIDAPAVVPFALGNKGRLELRDLVLVGRAATAALVDLQHDTSELEAVSTDFLLAAAAVRAGGAVPAAVNLASIVPLDAGLAAGVPALVGPSVRMEDCVVAADWAVSAVKLRRLDVADSFFCCQTGCVSAEQLANCTLRTTDLRAGADLAVLGNSAALASGALADRDAVVALLPGIPPTSSVQEGSVCVRATRLLFSSFHECRFVAGVGLAASATLLVDMSDDVFGVAITGVLVLAAVQTRLRGEAIGSLFPPTPKGPIPVPVSAFGVQLPGLAAGVSISDCTVAGFRVGVALGVEDDLAGFVPSLVDVQIQSNRIEASNVGIRLGSKDGPTSRLQLRRVSISGNHVVAAVCGIHLGLPKQDDQKDEAVDVAENDLAARVGIAVLGRRAQIRGNRVHLARDDKEKEARIGILLERVDFVTCEGNVVTLREKVLELDVPFLVALVQTQVEDAGDVVDAHLGPDADDPRPAACVVLKGRRVRLVGNSAGSHENAALVGLAVVGAQHLVVQGNAFTAGGCDLRQIDDLVFEGNQATGDVVVAAAKVGVVSNNDVRTRAGPDDGDILISDAVGRWKVNENRLDGVLQFRPPIESKTVVTTKVVKTLVEKNLGPTKKDSGGAKVKKSLKSKKGAEEPAAAKTFSGEFAGGKSKGLSKDVPSKTSFDLEVWAETVSAEVVEKWTIVVEKYDVVTLTETHVVEERCDLQCNDNWSADLFVGTQAADIAKESVVQLVGNRAVREITVAKYDGGDKDGPRLLAVGNVARSTNGVRAVNASVNDVKLNMQVKS